MGSSQLTGVICTDCRSPYPAGCIDPPCPQCGSRRRTFLQTRAAEIQPQGTFGWLRTDKKARVLGYGDSGSVGNARSGNAETDDTISLVIEERPPRNEEDTGRICRTLAAAMSQSGESFTVTVSGDRDVDGELRSTSRVLRVQVVKALAEMNFWRKLALTLRQSLRLSLPQALDFMKTAIACKTQVLPAVQRARLVLALDAERLPALALEPVVNEFRSTLGGWTAEQGFQQVWLVGPGTRLTWRLDENPE